jgi:hypothetical protein
MNTRYHAALVCCLIFAVMFPRSAVAAGVAIEALWHREANGPEICTLGSATQQNPPKVAGVVGFTPILTLGEWESGRVYRLVIKEVAGHDLHCDGEPGESPRTVGDD